MPLLHLVLNYACSWHLTIQLPYSITTRSVIAAFVIIGLVVMENFFVSFGNPESVLVKAVDYSFSAVLLLLWIGFHVYLILGTQREWFCKAWDEVEKNDNISGSRVLRSSKDVEITTRSNEQKSRSSSQLRRSSSRAQAPTVVDLDPGTAI